MKQPKPKKKIKAVTYKQKLIEYKKKKAENIKTRKPTKKRSDRTKLLKELTTLSHEYIRKRDNYACITCGASGLTGRNCHAGHYISVRFKRIAFDEKNMNCQCFKCNVTYKGNLIIYRIKMIEKYGIELVKNFENIEISQDVYKLYDDEIKQLIEYYKGKFNLFKD